MGTSDRAAGFRLLDRKTMGVLAAAVAVVVANAVIVALYPRFATDAPPEWPVMVDLLLVVPLLYLVVNRKQGRQAVIGALALAGAGTVVGSLMLPTESKQLWAVLEEVRIAAVILVVALQAAWMATILVRVVRSSRGKNVELALEDAIHKHFGNGGFAHLARLEGRVWLYAFRRRPLDATFPGLRHFHVAKQGMNASNQAAFLVLAAVEIPVAHALIHLFDPMAALVVTALSVYGFAFMLAEYHATLHRPISVGVDGLRVRYGVVADFRIEWTSIASIEPVIGGGIRRAKARIRLQGMGEANVLLHLAPGTRVRGLFGERTVREVYLGVDDPRGLIEAIEAQLRRD